jgi:hypothetical protein
VFKYILIYFCNLYFFFDQVENHVPSVDECEISASVSLHDSSSTEMTIEMLSANNALNASCKHRQYRGKPLDMLSFSDFRCPTISNVATSGRPIYDNKGNNSNYNAQFESTFSGTQVPLNDSVSTGTSSNNNESATTSSSIGGSSALSSKLLHEAFASLSLTDKCALSLSIGQLGNNVGVGNPSVPNNTTIASICHDGVSSGTSGLSTPRQNGSASGSFVANTPVSTSIGGNVVNALDNNNGNISLNLSTHSVDDISEIQSVLSETDKESLDVAMSMMGHLELRQVEDEVRMLQMFSVGLQIFG